MPSTNQAGGRDLPELPGIEEDIGHNPARFLDWDLVGHADRKGLLKSRIRGIDKIAVCRAYWAAEHHPDVGPTDGPREGVLRLLDQREEFLEEHGERPERLMFGPRRPPEYYATETDDDRDEKPRTAAAKLSRMRSERVATDGGERDGE